MPNGFTSDMKSGRINVGFGVFSRRCPACPILRMALSLQGHPQHPLHDPITIDENVRQRYPDRDGASI
jgi:hypothetical protein